MRSRKLLRILVVATLVASLLVISLGPLSAQASSGCVAAFHVVCRGENLTRIAMRYGTTVHAIAQANGIWNPNCIFAGQVLKIPCGAPKPCYTCPPAPCATCGRVHVVQWGETLSGIAWRYGTSVWALAPTESTT